MTVSSIINSINNAQQKLGSLKTLPSTKIKKLITDEVLKNYLSTVFNHYMLIHLYFVFNEMSLIRFLQGNILWPHPFTLFSRLYFINQNIIL